MDEDTHKNIDLPGVTKLTRSKVKAKPLASLFIKINQFIYPAMSGLSCSTQALFFRCAGSVVVAGEFSCPAVHGILVLWPGMEPASPT